MWFYFPQRLREVPGWLWAVWTAERAEARHGRTRPTATPSRAATGRSETDEEIGEWRCRCPSDPAYDKSMNPRFVSACSVCGAERPRTSDDGGRTGDRR